MGELLLVLVGGFLGWYGNNQVSKQSLNAVLLDEHIRDIEAYADALENYWLSSSKTQLEERCLAAVVKSRNIPITAFYGTAAERLPQRQLEEYDVNQMRLFKTGQGGTFETVPREANPDVAVDCRAYASQLIHLLRMAKQEQLSLKSQLRRSGKSALGRFGHGPTNPSPPASS